MAYIPIIVIVVGSRVLSHHIIRTAFYDYSMVGDTKEGVKTETGAITTLILPLILLPKRTRVKTDYTYMQLTYYTLVWVLFCWPSSSVHSDTKYYLHFVILPLPLNKM